VSHLIKFFFQAPSFRFEQYIQQQQKPLTTASDAAGSIYKAINALKAAVATQRKLLASLSDTCTQYQEAVLSQQLTGISIFTTADASAATAANPASNSDLSPLGHEAAEAAAAGEQSAAALLDNSISRSDSAAAAAVKLEPEEVALLMGALTSGLQRDLEWMVSNQGGGTVCLFSCFSALSPRD
jgi:hypothetical protein